MNLLISLLQLCVLLAFSSLTVDAHLTSLRNLKISKRIQTKKVENPKFCHGIDCPQYKVINTTKNYELREYVSTSWVSTQLQKIKYDEAVSDMFMKLFDYIQGDNKKKEKIAMTAPVLIRVIGGPGPACVNNFTESFFIAPKVKDPPAPSNKDVFLSSLPKQRVFVSSFGGREYEKDWLKHADELTKSLVKDGRKFETGHFYTAGYDSPFRIFDRHNEIWIVSKE